MSTKRRIESLDIMPSRDVVQPAQEGLQDSSRPIILSVLSTAGPLTLTELELIVRRRAERLLPSDQFEKDLEDLCFASLVEIHGYEIHGHLKCRLTAHGVTIGQNLARKMMP